LTALPVTVFGLAAVAVAVPSVAVAVLGGAEHALGRRGARRLRGAGSGASLSPSASALRHLAIWASHVRSAVLVAALAAVGATSAPPAANMVAVSAAANARRRIDFRIKHLPTGRG
jgi:hypothetical protein